MGILRKKNRFDFHGGPGMVVIGPSQGRIQPCVCLLIDNYFYAPECWGN